jgi:hypothetical protein
MVHTGVEHTVVDVVAGLLVLVHQKLHLKYGAEAAQAQDTAAMVVDVIWQVVDRLEDILVEKLLDEPTGNLFQGAVTDSV